MSEFQFAWPWAFLLLPLPLLALLLPPARNANGQSLRVPWFAQMRGAAGNSQRAGRWLRSIAILAWLALVLASARPQWVDEAESFPISGRDLLLAVDISGSMDTRDMELGGGVVNRLTVVKQVAGQFIERRRGDRVGLVLFGSRAYLQTPLTFDTETTATLLEESEIGLAGRETAIGDAIGLSVKRLRQDQAAHRVLILLTDGANTAGEVPPEQAARFAAREGLTIYTIGVGAERMMVRDLFGSRVVNPSTDLDEDALRAIAEMTGGAYFRARDTAELEAIYQTLDELEPIESDVETVRPVLEWFYWPLGFAVVLALLLLLYQSLGQLVLPRRDGRKAGKTTGKVRRAGRPVLSGAGRG